MTQRLVAAFVAVIAVAALLVYAAVARLPYATYAPGGTLDVLGTDPDNADAEIIQVDGADTFRDDGGLLMTTVQVSPPVPPGTPQGENLWGLLSTWVDGDSAVYPYSAVHTSDETPESSREQGQRQMATSQDAAVEVALAEMGIDVPQTIEVTSVTAGMPSEDVLRVGDVIRSVDGAKADDLDEMIARISTSTAGEPLPIVVTRDGERVELEVTPVRDEERDRSVIGIGPEIADYQFPFEVKINISPAIGGPSAGLVFSLAVYDTLTEGSLTGGREVAGTGEIAADGTVGPIGGIQQKIAGAREDGAELFLVPVENCADALGADAGDMRLMMAETMHDVRVALEAYAADEDATLPSCEDADDVLSAAGAVR
jgi:PDZ domain-containing protein